MGVDERRLGEGWFLESREYHTVVITLFLMFIGLKATPVNIHFKNLLIYRKNINNFELYTYVLCVLSHFSRVQPFASPWTVALQAPLAMGFSRQEY